MKIDVAKYGTSLAVLITVTNPSSDAAENPTAASAKFYKVVDGALVASGIANLTLLQQDGTPGVWGGFAALGGIDIADLVVIAQATVGGVARSAVMVLGPSGTVSTELAIGAPQITATPGIDVNDSKGPAV